MVSYKKIKKFCILYNSNMAILYKTIPIWYSKKNEILYMDAIEKFDDSNFKVLKKVSKSNPLSQYATHKIKLRDIENQDKRFHKLLRTIKNKITYGILEFGYPIGISYSEDGNTEEINSDEGLINFDNSVIYENIEVSKELYPFTSKVPKLLAIGQGLTFVDEASKFMYDAGGSVGYSKFIPMINTKIKYSILLSHPHYDHYKYIAKMIDDGLVNQIFMNPIWYGGKRFKKLITTAISNGIKIGNPASFKGYSFEYFPKNSDVNKMSTLCKSSTWLLTGDQCYSNILKRNGPINIDNFQIPHHGSWKRKTGFLNASDVTRAKNSWVSFGTKNTYGHPHIGSANFWKSIPSSKYNEIKK